ncbi:30S ribosomal protein S21 [Bremerella cremea]|uniref:Small ribosomal subunit protein bS21 n=1 Tax=Blastopirellula marina TaxID=124 RepID=A0A2S8FPY2_9BACT|nr:30S ribosomal protein S21 [Blastopirellula marina]RCS46714.1 30S ribosomal protein S21 [Bremerella cremea]
MTSKIELQSNESIDSAVRRFHKQISTKFSRSWYKSRAGYYEKPSVRKRRKRRLAQINRRAHPKSNTLKMKMGRHWLYARKRPWP